MDNIESLVEVVKKEKPKRVLLQLPEGLRMKALEIVNAIEKECEVILSVDPCYGACDLRDDEAVRAGCDLLVHIGHSKFYKDIETKTKVLYFPWKMNVELGNIDFSIIKEKRIGVLAPVQHLDMVADVSGLLERAGKIAAKGGQILGCWTGNANKIKDKVDAFLVIGSGSFHALGIKSKAYILDLEKKEIRPVDLALFEKKRQARIAKARDAESFGILVSSKQGQFDLERAEKIKQRLVQRNKKALILIMDEITNEKLLGLGFDAFVNTACPRIELEGMVINAEDFELLMGA